MTPQQRLSLEQSRIRTQLNVILSKESLTEDERAQLEALSLRAQSLEIELRAAIIAAADGADTTTPENVERRQLEGRASLGRYFECAMQARQLDGAEAELTAAAGLSGNTIPWSAIAPRPSPMELRADAVTTIPTTTSTMQDPTLARVFAKSVTSFLRIAMPSVSPGDHNYPIMTAGASADTVAAGVAHDADAATFQAVVITPKRLTARYLWRREDAASFGGLDDALRADLAGAMASALDNAIITGSGVSPHVSGLLGGGLTAPADPDAKAVLSDFVGAVVDSVDGIYAGGPSDVRLLMGPATYRLAGQTFFPSLSESVDVYLRRISGGVLTSAHVPAAVSNIEGALTVRGMAGAGVAPMWEGVQLIRDDVTGAAKGEIALTAVALYGFAIRRAGQFSRLKFKLA